MDALTADADALTADADALTADADDPTADADDPTATRQPLPRTTASPTGPLSPSFPLRLRQSRVDLLTELHGFFVRRMLHPEHALVSLLSAQSEGVCFLLLPLCL